jgi:hypothetical protein
LSQSTTGATKPIVQVLAIAAFLAAMRITVDTSFAYLAILALAGTRLFLGVLAVLRLVQKRFREAVLVIGLCGIPFVLPSFIDPPYWTFRLHKAEYLKAIEADPSPSPKYKVFDWGMRTFQAAVLFSTRSSTMKATTLSAILMFVHVPNGVIPGSSRTSGVRQILPIAVGTEKRSGIIFTT